MSQKQSFDVVVIGVGTMGASVAYNLAKLGLSVLGLEQYDIVHNHGSHGGKTRIIRKAYFEQEAYVPLLDQAYGAWRELEEETGQKIYHQTGLLYAGEANSEVISGVRSSASAHSISIQNWSQEQLSNEIPAIHISGDQTILFEAEAGFLLAEEAISLYARLAKSAGAQINTGEKLVSWEGKGKDITVTTDCRTYSARRIVFTAGSGTSDLIPKRSLDLKVTRQVLGWFKVKSESPPELPCWLVDSPVNEGSFYGFPGRSFQGVHAYKVGLHAPGAETTPNTPARQVDQEEINLLSGFMEQFLATEKLELVSAGTCLYTYSSDGHCVVDFLPATDKRVIVAAGFSGHGFKFASIFGLKIAQMVASGKPDPDLEFLSLSRLSQ